MGVLSLLLWALASHGSVASVIPAIDDDLFSARRRTVCQNSDSSRGCWGGKYDIQTDVDLSYPTTGVTVPYTLEITNTTCNPDGSGSRVCLLVNGQYPGPTLRAQWGDTLKVTVINSLQHNGTSIHFHGVRQLNTPASDGVNGITQCAIAPGDSATYSFQATQHGTSWYHSHSSVQYGDGVMGPIVFEGPSTADYDIDLGPYTLTDVFGTLTASQVEARAKVTLEREQAPPQSSNVLINGTNRNSENGGGRHNLVSIQSGKKYRLRLINASLNNYVRVSLDRHSMLVIAADFVSVKPFRTDWLFLGIGQRYDVVITADQTGGSYWFRANVPFSCFGYSTHNGSAIWTYDDARVTTPTSTANPGEPFGCYDESVVPYWPGAVPSASFDDSLVVNVTNASVPDEGTSTAVWILGKPIWTNYSDPTIGYAVRGDSDYPAPYNAIETAPEGSWNYWVIDNSHWPVFVPHPMHLHGHNFYIVGYGAGKFQPGTKLNWRSPSRRDTQSVPGHGWLALAFKSDNPGAWLMHCHIGVHISEGLGLQFVEAPGQIKLPDAAQYRKTCRNWDAYAAKTKYVQAESGL